MNRRGQIGEGLVIAVALGIIGLLFGLGVLFSTSFKFYAAGITVIVLTFIYGVAPGLRGNLTRTKRNFIVVLFLVGVGLVLVPALGLTQNTAFGDTFVKPSWARLECAPTDAFEGNFDKWLDQQTLFKCDANTEECRFTVESTAGTGITDLAPYFNYYECDLNGNGCQLRGSGFLVSVKKITLDPIKSGRSYKFESLSIFPSKRNSVTHVIQEWRPWKIYRYVGGAKFEAKADNCDLTDLSSSDLDKLRKQDYVPRLTRQGGIGQKWINYVDDWNYGPATNVFLYNGQRAYCTSGQVFSIVTLTSQNGQLKSIDPTYSATLPSGEQLKGLGNKIADVACCPNEPNCGTDFKFKPQPVANKECFSDLQCSNAGSPIPLTKISYVTYSCVQNKCVRSAERTVECTSSAACASGSICDLSQTNYGRCIKQTNQDYCGDKICSVNENANTCAADCAVPKIDGLSANCAAKASASPWLGYTLMTKTTQPTFGDKAKYYLSFGFAGTNQPTTVEYCEARFVPYYVLGSVVIVFLIILLMMLRKPRRGRRR